jgi:hypothetical protein
LLQASHPAWPTAARLVADAVGLYTRKGHASGDLAAPAVATFSSDNLSLFTAGYFICKRLLVVVAVVAIVDLGLVAGVAP